MTPFDLDSQAGEVYATLARIDARLARLEAVLARYEPLLDEVTRRMAGPMKWRKT